MYRTILRYTGANADGHAVPCGELLLMATADYATAQGEADIWRRDGIRAYAPALQSIDETMRRAYLPAFGDIHVTVAVIAD